MISPRLLLKILKKNNIDTFFGVPDSVLKNFTGILDKKKIKNIVCANEGSAIAMAIGHYLNTKKIPVVYFQNAGLGNAYNPLISIAHKNVYDIPLLLLIGWRGNPDLKDEPQHIAQGKTTIDSLKLLNIKHIVLDNDKKINKINKLVKTAKKTNSQIAILIKNNRLKKEENNKYEDKPSRSKLYRKDVIRSLLKRINNSHTIFSSTGYSSRELNHHKKDLKINKGSFFYNVGGMGHTLSISLGYSLKSKKKIICLDGDGSLLMHMGSMSSIATLANKNFNYILLDNNSHESVGGQKTNIDKLDIKKLSISFNFKKYFLSSNKASLDKNLNKIMRYNGPNFLHIKIKKGAPVKLSRPTNFKDLKKKL